MSSVPSSRIRMVQVPGKKRRSVACSHCRAKKIKCNGSIPCSNCLDRALQCVAIPRRRLRASDSYSMELSPRVPDTDILAQTFDEDTSQHLRSGTADQSTSPSIYKKTTVSSRTPILFYYTILSTLRCLLWLLTSDGSIADVQKDDVLPMGQGQRKPLSLPPIPIHKQPGHEDFTSTQNNAPSLDAVIAQVAEEEDGSVFASDAVSVQFSQALFP